MSSTSSQVVYESDRLKLRWGLSGKEMESLHGGGVVTMRLLGLPGALSPGQVLPMTLGEVPLHGVVSSTRAPWVVRLQRASPSDG